MIKRIGLKNFKCFETYCFDLKKINLLTGYNGRGKSSLLQSILMLSQSIRKDKNIEKLHLTGEFVYLGDFDEILYDDKNIYLDFHFELDDPQCKEVDITYTLSGEDFKIGIISGCKINNEDYFDTVGKNENGETENTTKKEFSKPIPQGLLNQFKFVHFISANRLGPVKYVEKMEVPDFHSVGTDGAFTINTLATFKEKVSQKMNINQSDSKEYSLQDSVSSWMDYIMTGGEISVQGDAPDKKNTVLSLSFGIDKDGKRTFQSYNVGFGYSYILSIVVSALIAKKDSILIVENPEAHLHPMAQSRITELLSKTAEKDVQIFVETHSEHILNGFRLCALRDNFNISNTDLSINFFKEDFKISPLEIQENGRIPNWPEGFFDQQERDLVEIMRLGAGK